MKDNRDRGALSGQSAQGPRRERLKRALRENLKRRKSQARERGDFTHASIASDDVMRHDRKESPDK